MAGTSDGSRILIVEDEFIIADLIRSFLESEGFAIAGVAADVGEALRLAALTRPALAVIDIRLARGDGVELAQALREQFGTPTLFTSGAGDPATLARSRAAAPRGFLGKPFRGAQLIAAVRAALAQT